MQSCINLVIIEIFGVYIVDELIDGFYFELAIILAFIIGNIGLREGNVIEHQRFGIGTVVKIEGSGENTKATVNFKNAGTKQLLLKFAKYTIVG